MGRPADLATLLQQLDPQADLAQRHLWLIHLMDWLRGQSKEGTPAVLARVGLFLDAIEARPGQQAALQAWWARLVDTVDLTTLLADFGFTQRTALLSELLERVGDKLLPRSPETRDASELFMLALPQACDAQWLAALDAPLLDRLARLLQPATDAGRSRWEALLLDAITYCAGHILSTGFAPELRLRMGEAARQAQPFHALIADVEALRSACQATPADPGAREAAAQALRARLDACRTAAGTVYGHLEENGISVGLVFRLRQLRERILRVRALLDCVQSPAPAQAAARLLAQLVLVGREKRSLRALVRANASLLAAKMAERNAETGEHYITRNRDEYRDMLHKAAGGGAVIALTTLLKFALYAFTLSAFWVGFWAGVNYAVSFVLVQLLHFTVATKQPAMTAPAMAAKLKDIGSGEAIEAFVDEVSHLVRSQVAAVLGNVLVVLPVVMLLSLALGWGLGAPVIDADKAQHVLHDLHLGGPSVLFAAFTGVLLFASSLVAGWAENSFVLHRLDSALRYNPRITAVLGDARAARWARFMRENISGFAANVSLGFMLGLVPAFAAFFGLGLEVRHVTLSAGQIGVALVALGWQALHSPALWWAVATLPLMGMLNVGVSFYLAFRLALRAHNVSGVDRARIYAAIRQRLRRAPLGFFWPPRNPQAAPTPDAPPALEEPPRHG